MSLVVQPFSRITALWKNCIVLLFFFPSNIQLCVTDQKIKADYFETCILEQCLQAPVSYHGELPWQWERREDSLQDETHWIGECGHACTQTTSDMCGAKTVTSKTRLLQVDVMKDAYKQGLQSEDDDDGMGDEIKPKDVGHNIYILAHQVKEKIKFELV